jgi:hypothetical protein
MADKQRGEMVTITCQTRREVNRALDDTFFFLFYVECFVYFFAALQAVLFYLVQRRIFSLTPTFFVSSLFALFVRSHSQRRIQSANRVMAPMVIHTHLDETTPTASSPTSSPGNTSDKENYQRSVHKRKTPTMAPRSQNKRRLTARHSNVRYAQSQSSTQRSSGSLYYDPDQDPAERRRVRKDLRELGREAHGRLSRILKTREITR